MARLGKDSVVRIVDVCEKLPLILTRLGNEIDVRLFIVDVAKTPPILVTLEEMLDTNGKVFGLK